MRNNKKLDNLSIVLVLIFLFLPIFIIMLFSFNTSALNITFEGFTFKWYKELFSNRILMDALVNTLIIAVISTVISTILGTISAYALKKYDFPLKKIIKKLLYIPIVIPEIVLGISLLCIYTLIKLDLGMFTLILAHICFSTPFVIINVESVLDTLDNNVIEAAGDLGAGKLTTFFKIVVPFLLPGILSGADLAFTLSLDDVVISYFTAGPSSNTLPLHIYSIIKTGVNPSVNALITIMILIIILVLTFNVIRNLKSKEVR